MSLGDVIFLRNLVSNYWIMAEIMQFYEITNLGYTYMYLYDGISKILT